MPQMFFPQHRTRKSVAVSFRGVTLVGVVLLLNYISIVLTDANSGDTYYGYVYGSLFTHAALSACWAVLGPGPLGIRLPLAIVWVLALPVVPVPNFIQYVQLALALDIAYWTGAILFTQWLMIQPVVTLFNVKRDVYIQTLQGHRPFDTTEKYQLRILHILVVVSIAAAYCALGRFVALHEASDRTGLAITLATEGIWAFGVTLVTVPLIMTSLLQRRPLQSTLVCLMLIAIGTCVEYFLTRRIRVADTGLGIIGASILSSAALTLIVAGILRLHGFRLHARRNINRRNHQSE